MTPLRKRVTRRSEALIREAGKWRRLVVTLYPTGAIGIRPERARREETISLFAVYQYAVSLRVRKEMSERKTRRKHRQRLGR